MQGVPVISNLPELKSTVAQIIFKAVDSNRLLLECEVAFPDIIAAK